MSRPGSKSAWVSSSDQAEMERFLAAYPSSIASDDGAPVFMANSAFDLRYEQER